jgi:hypothetical protein
MITQHLKIRGCVQGVGCGDNIYSQISEDPGDSPGFSGRDLPVFLRLVVTRESLVLSRHFHYLDRDVLQNRHMVSALSMPPDGAIRLAPELSAATLRAARRAHCGD